jgi:hypothetical protein
MAMKIIVFNCDVVKSASVLEEHTASIFRAARGQALG